MVFLFYCVRLSLCPWLCFTTVVVFICVLLWCCKDEDPYAYRTYVCNFLCCIRIKGEIFHWFKTAPTPPPPIYFSICYSKAAPLLQFSICLSVVLYLTFVLSLFVSRLFSRCLGKSVLRSCGISFGIFTYIIAKHKHTSKGFPN